MCKCDKEQVIVNNMYTFSRSKAKMLVEDKLTQLEQVELRKDCFYIAKDFLLENGNPIYKLDEYFEVSSKIEDYLINGYQAKKESIKDTISVQNCDILPEEEQPKRTFYYVNLGVDDAGDDAGDVLKNFIKKYRSKELY